MQIKDLIIETKKIEWESITDLQPIDLKRDFHSQKIKDSIIQNGFSRAIYVWKNNEDNTIYCVDGHLRMDLLRELKTDGYDIPDLLSCTFLNLKNKDDAIKCLLQVFNSKSNPIIKESLELWAEEDGFNLDDFEFILDDLNIEFEDFNNEKKNQELDTEGDDDVPESVPSITVKGDLYELGEHRLLCGDSTMIDDVEKLMDGAKADMVHTDPPYNIAYQGGSKKREQIKNDDIDDFNGFLSDIYKNYSLAIKDGGAIYVWHAPSETHNFIGEYLKSGFLFKSYIVWNKNNSTFGRADYHWKHEPCIYGWKDGASHKWFGDRKQTTVWDFDRPSRSDAHPTMKPLDLCNRAIMNSSHKGDLVLDLFLGSGSTLIACEKTSRKCYGMELDEKYCDVIVKRYIDYCKKNDKPYTVKRNGIDCLS